MHFNSFKSLAHICITKLRRWLWFNNHLDYACNSVRSQAVNVTNCLSLNNLLKHKNASLFLQKHNRLWMIACCLWTTFQRTKHYKVWRKWTEKPTDMLHTRRWLKQWCEIWRSFSKDMMLLKGLLLCISPHRREEKSTLWDLSLASADGGIIHSFEDLFFYLFIYLLSVEQRQKKVKLEL